MRKFHLGHCLEEDNWAGIRKDLDKNPIGTVNGSSDKEEILEILSNFGIKLIKAQGVGRGAQGEVENSVTVRLWGTGKPLREFMYSEDLA